MMKLTGKFLLLVILCMLSHGAFAQEVDLSKKISIHANEISILEIINELSGQANVNFAFNRNELPLDQKVSINVKDISVADFMSQYFPGWGIQYKLIEKQIVLKPGKGASVKDEKEKPPPKFTISGFLKDSKTGEILIGATVLIKELMKGTMTNGYGFYSLTLPRGKYTLEYSYVGYEKKQLPVELAGNQNISVQLALDTALMEEVIIHASEQDDLVTDEQMSEINLKPVQINKMPGFMGEVDIIKSLQAIPGVKSFGDGSTYFFVRGGNKDQNLILVDEAPIYNPSHLLGFYSAIVPEAIKDMSIYKADIPVEHGGRISSLMDIKTKDGNIQRYSGFGNIGLITSTLTFEGPIKKEKSSFFISSRFTPVSSIIKRTDPTLKFGFYDLNLKLNWQPSRKNRFYISLYSGYDEYNKLETGLGTFGLSWGNFAGTFRWNHLFGERLFSNFTIYGSSYEYFMHINKERAEYWSSNIGNLHLKYDFTYFHDPDNTYKFGIKVGGHSFNPGNLQVNDPLVADFVPAVPGRQSGSASIYFANKHVVSDDFTLKYGLRANSWRIHGPTSIYLLNDAYYVSDTMMLGEKEVTDPYLNLEPRLSLRWTFSPHSSIKASYNKNVQYIHLISNSISPFTTLDVWLPSDPNIKPQRANIFALGYFTRLFDRSVEFSAEAYYKKMHNQIGYTDHAKLFLNPTLERELRFGSARSYGIEFMLQKEYGPVSGWLAYTLSKTINRTEGINGGQPYPASYDRPHEISILLNYQAGQRLKVSGQWIFLSGGAYTSPSGYYYYQGHAIPLYPEVNNDRLPNYHRLDVSMSYRLNKKDYKYFGHELIVSVFNLYNRYNPVAINYNKTINENGKAMIPSDYSDIPDYVTTKMFMLSIVPSIRYQFRF